MMIHFQSTQRGTPANAHCYAGLFIVALALFLSTWAVRGVAQAPDPDPFLWLEDKKSQRAVSWVTAQNDRSTTYLESTPKFSTLVRDANLVLGGGSKLPLADIMGHHVYGFWQDDNNPRGVWRRAALEDYVDGNPEWDVLLDIDQLAAQEDEKWTWAGVKCLPPDHERCMIGLSRSGLAAAVWREFLVSERAFLKGGFELPESQSNWAWFDKDTLFVATDWGDGKMGDAYSLVAKFWRRGQSMGQAQTIVDASGNGISVWPQVIHRPNDRFAYVGVSRSWFNTEYYAVADDGEMTLLPCSQTCEPRGYIDGRILFEVRNDWTHNGTNYRKGAFVAVDTKTLESEIVYAPQAGESVRAVHVGRTDVFVVLLRNVSSVVLRFQRQNDQWRHQTVDLPGDGVIQLAPINGFRIESTHPESNALLASYESIAVPPTLYFLPEKGQPREVFTLSPQFDATDVVVEQRWATSKDGTRVPYYILAKRNVLEAGNAPLILFGYGGFHIPVLPRYRAIHGKLWTEHDGIFVFSNIRGGGEFGAAWHQAAVRENRQNAYDDYYAVAEALLKDGVTSREKLGIWGASNGGLLTAVALTQRPELFGAVISEVPLTDMVRYVELGGGDWLDEYGDPDVPKEAQYLRFSSPYHNVRPETDYPITMLVSSSMDDIVHAGHARKLAARLEEAGSDFYYYEAIEGGHSGTGIASGAGYEWALQYAFFHDVLFSDGTQHAPERSDGLSRADTN